MHTALDAGGLISQTFAMAELLAQTAEDREIDGAAHAGRIQDLTADFLRRLEGHVPLPEGAFAWPVAATLHDIGKSLIPLEILRKPGPLNPEERRLIERHTVEGEAIIKRCGRVLLPTWFWDEAATIARSHHERQDGTGYPHGLAGMAVPPSARLTHIVDVFDALTHDRTYHKALPPTDALALMQRDEGGFDPEALGCFCEMKAEIRRTQ